MLKSLARRVSLAALAVLAALPARAEVMQHEAAGIQFDLPTGWTHEAEEDGALRVMNADESIELVLSVADADTLEGAINGVLGEVDDYLKDVKVSGEGK